MVRSNSLAGQLIRALAARPSVTTVSSPVSSKTQFEAAMAARPVRVVDVPTEQVRKQENQRSRGNPAVVYRTSEPTAEKADTLIEALPWILRLKGAVIVVRYSGSAMLDPELRKAFAADMVFLRHVGIKPVVVHGGGPQVAAMLQRLGIQSEFKGGLRVTTAETADVARMVLVGQVGREIVGLINQHGPYAVGVSGEDAQLLTAERRPATVDGAPVDIGQVGDVVQVNVSALTDLIDAGRIPVVSAVAPDVDGVLYNLSPDAAASALAIAVGARKLVMLTDVEGLYARYRDPGTLISRLTADELAELLPTLEAGLVPRMEACLRAVQGGVPAVHIVDSRIPHSILLEVFTAERFGTMVSGDPEMPRPSTVSRR
jgi:acetylglutamate kinase